MPSDSQELRTAPLHRSPVGRLEIIGGLAGFFAVGHALAFLFDRFHADPVVTGVVMAQIAGVAALSGFALAVALRVRRLKPFGFTRTTAGWLLVGAMAGLVLFALKGFITTPLAELFDLGDGAQSDLVGGAQGGTLALALTAFGLAVIGPLGEEFLFRGVVQTALLRYGTMISVLGSALVFALAHGINVVTPVALAFGVLSAELYRRSGSIWPAVVAHVTHNAPTPFLLLLL